MNISLRRRSKINSEGERQRRFESCLNVEEIVQSRMRRLGIRDPAVTDEAIRREYEIREVQRELNVRENEHRELKKTREERQKALREQMQEMRDQEKARIREVQRKDEDEEDLRIQWLQEDIKEQREREEGERT